MSNLSMLPSVDHILNQSKASELARQYGRKLVVDAIRERLDEIRSSFKVGEKIPNEGQILQGAGRILAAWTKPTLYPVINATGVIIHTNLGRSPISQEAMEAAMTVATGYSNLEFDMKKGKRGSRLTHTNDLLRRLTGAQSSLVVNNNAAAVLLALTALAKRRRVLISRTQLVEIGGGFRIPDVMKQSGAKLVEIGTTNRVHLYDYENAINEQPIYLVMRAHRSNFRLEGFTAEPSLNEICELAHKNNIPLLDDLGSGTLVDTSKYNIAHEPMVQESLDAGADLVCFSGDKLLGGPQAGIIVGREDLIEKLKRHPLARAIRADKMALAALSKTLEHYLKNESEEKIPIWQMISASPDVLYERARDWRKSLGVGSLVQGQSTIGGGSTPGEVLPTWLFVLDVPKASLFLRKLRDFRTPIIARAHKDQVVFDPRTVLAAQDESLKEGIIHTLESDE